MKLAAVFFLPLLPLMTQAADYTARRTAVDDIEVVQLLDNVRHVEVSIAPSVGNMAYEMKVNGQNVLWSPVYSPADLRAQQTFCCIPFLAPWANRLSDDFFWANGKKFLINPELGNIRRDNHQKPIHGLLNFSPLWTVAASGADEHAAWVTSRLEFWRYPALMAQFPFAHNIAMTYRLSRGELEVETAIENLSASPLPVAIGYHPYFRLHDAPRDQWKVHIAARDHLVLSRELIPTGERRPVEFADPQPLHATQLDDVFTNLVRNADGRAQFWVEGARQRITVTYGPRYQVAVVYAPAAREFICFEPMAAITDAFNLAHAGVYKELESIPPGGTWKESFWIAATGF
jgi:aldose 1-epimerase